MKNIWLFLVIVVAVGGSSSESYAHWRLKRKNRQHDQLNAALNANMDVTEAQPALQPESVDIGVVAPEIPVEPSVTDKKTFVQEKQDPKSEEATEEAIIEELIDDEDGEVEEAIVDEPIIQPKKSVVKPSKAINLDEQNGAPVSDDFDEEEKKVAVEALVEKGVKMLRQHPVDQVMSTFLYDSNFTQGELYLFVLDKNGTSLAHGEQNDLIWDNLYNLKDSFGTLLIQEILKKAKEGGGWVNYQWRNASKKTYVKEVEKNDKKYVIGSGYYPHSKSDAVVTLVKGAVSLFNEGIRKNLDNDVILSAFSYPLGRFVFGDLYLYGVAFDGVQVAHGEQPGFIGSNVLDYKDATGTLVNQEIIKALKLVEAGTGIWFDYVSKNTTKTSYAEKVIDAKGKEYFLACGYYPEVDRNRASDLVKRGYRYMKANGKSQAVRAFSDRRDNEFRFGDLYLTVYDLKGVVIADGFNPSLIGSNAYDLKDEDGDYFVREMIEKANTGGGWVDYKEHNTFKVSYVEKVNLGVESFVIMCGLYPVNKKETMTLLAKSAADHLKSHDLEESLREFVKPDSKFIRGDLSIFVFNSLGICLANGDQYNLIWRNLFNATDENGKPYIKEMINLAKRGTADYTYNIKGGTRMVHIEPVQKGDSLYIVGSGYYL